MVLHFVINDKNSNLSNISTGNGVSESDPPSNHAISSKRDIRTLTLIIDPLNQEQIHVFSTESLFSIAILIIRKSFQSMYRFYIVEKVQALVNQIVKKVKELNKK